MEGITGSYYDDYNISIINKMIIQKIKDSDKTSKDITKELSIIKERIKTPQLYIDRITDLDRIKELESILSSKKEILNVYLNETSEYITKYESMKNNKKVIIFGLEDQTPKDTETDIEKLKIIESFLEIAKKYININVVHINRINKNRCLDCNTHIDNSNFNDEECTFCPKCGTEYENVVINKICKDNMRINNNSKDDESIENFLKAFYRYQGLQQYDINDKIFKELDIYFKKRGESTGEDIKRLPLNSNNKRGNTNINMMINALASIKKEEYYEDVNLIGKKYWGWILPDLMHLKEKVINIYNKTQNGFYMISPEEKERNSSLGTQFRLYKTLRLLGHDCCREDFRIAENQDSRRKHEKLWKMMCEMANDDEIFYISD